MAASFIGRGVAFPLARDASGRLALVSGATDVERSIRLVLATYPGERPMRPEFGSTIADHVFAPADATTAGRLAHAVRTGLDRWEPRIELEDVRVHLDAAEEGVLYIEIVYRLRGTNDPRNLVFPFYVIPEHEEGVARQQAAATPGALTTAGPAGRR
jgi:phage baseplate assembly protein W